MTMPIDLVLLRHGESEGNVASHKSKKGDNSDFTPEFLSRHNSSWRLTDKGIGQIQTSGEWIKNHISKNFDRYYTSEYIRAIETAAVLDFPDANWHIEFYLRERDYGELDVMPDDMRKKNYGRYVMQRKHNPLLSAPPGGESMATLCLRVDRILNTLHRECNGKKVIIVCHGEVMEAFRIRLERLTEEKYKTISSSKVWPDKIWNGHILHYTRQNPQNKQLSQHLDWLYSICPNNPSCPTSPTWLETKRPKYSNQELLELANAIPRMVNNK
jgi:NAD+ kinase